MNRENRERDPVAVVLGGTVPHAEIIKKLKARGYYTILVDYFENPPAAKFADVHCRGSAMDIDDVLAAAKEYRAKLILSPCLDQQINIAIRASEELGLPHPFSSEIAMKVTNKRLMKKSMIEGGIPTAKYYVVEPGDDLRGLDLQYPIIVKPDDSCGSAGVYKLYSPEKLEETVQLAAQWGNSSKVIIEEFIQGTEMGVHCYVNQGKAHILFGTCKITVMKDTVHRQLCNVYIPKLRESLHAELERIINLIVEKFELPEYTPVFMQVIVDRDRVNVIEFSPRNAGGITSYIAERYAGFDLLSYSIDSYEGRNGACENGALGSFVCCYPVHCVEGVFDRVVGDERLLAEGTIDDLQILKEPGTSITTEKPSSANVLKAVLSGQTLDECFGKMKRVDEVLDVWNENGQSMVDTRFSVTRELLDEKIKILL